MVIGSKSIFYSTRACCLTLVWFFSFYSLAFPVVASGTLGVDQALEDFDQAQKLLKDHFPNYGLGSKNAELEQKIAQIRAKIANFDEKIDEIEFARLLRQAVSSTGDGAVCTTYPLDAASPLQLKLLDDAVVLNGVIRDTKVGGKFWLALGASGIQARPEVVKIDGEPIQQVLQNYAQHTCFDDKSSLQALNQAAQDFTSLHAFVKGHSQSSEITVLDEAGRQRNLTITNWEVKEGGVYLGHWDSLVDKPAKTPKLVWKNGVAMLQVGTFGQDRTKFEKRLAFVFKTIRRRKPEHFIIDLRGNAGGDISNAAFVLPYLTFGSRPLKRNPHFTDKYFDADLLVPTSLYGNEFEVEEAREAAKKIRAKGRSAKRWVVHPNGSRHPSFSVYYQKPTYRGHVHILMDERTSGVAISFAKAVRDRAKKATFYGRASYGLGDRVCDAPKFHLKLVHSGQKLQFPYDCYLLSKAAFKQRESFKVTFEPDVPLTLSNNRFWRRKDTDLEQVLAIIRGRTVEDPYIPLPTKRPKNPVVGLTAFNEPYRPPQLTNKQALADFDQAQALLKRHFPNYGLYPPTKQLNATFKAIRTEIKNRGEAIDRSSFAVFLRRAFAQVGEGHTCSELPQAPQWAFSLKLTEHKLLLDGVIFGIGKQPEVVKIDGKDANEVLNDYAELICIDGGNKTSARSFAAVEFSDLFYAVTGKQDVPLTVLDEAGKERDLVISSLKAMENGKQLGILAARSFFKSKSINLKWRDDKTIAIIKVPTFATDLKTFEKSMDARFKRIKGENATDLIIDLRGNTGGYIKNASILIAYLINTSHRMPQYLHFKSNQIKKAGLVQPTSKTQKKKQEKLRKTINRWIYDGRKFKRRKIVPSGYRYNHIGKSFGKIAYNGNLHVLIDEQTFSAATLFSNVIRQKRDVTFYGTNANGSSDRGCHRSPFEHELKHTKLRLDVAYSCFLISSSAFKRKTVRPVFEPDFRIGLSAEDFRDKKDMQLEFVLDRIRSRDTPLRPKVKPEPPLEAALVDEGDDGVTAN